MLRVRTTGLPPDACPTTRVSIHPTRGGSGFRLPQGIERARLDAQGALSLTGLPDAEWNVELGTDGFTFDPRSVRTKAGQPVDDLAFTATAIGSLQLHGVLRDDAGAPLPGLRLVCRTKLGPSMNGGAPGNTVTDADGRFTMDAPLVAGEPFSLHLDGGGHVLLQEKVHDMTGAHDARYLVRHEDTADPARELELVAVPAAIVTARLVDTGGRPVPFQWTELQERSDNRTPAWMAMAYATSRRDGTLEFPGVHAIDRPVRVATEGGGGAAASEPFQLTRGERTEIVLTVQLPGTVRGRLLDPQGRPVPGYRVSLGNFDTATGQQIDGSWMTVPTDRDGRFVFVGVAAGGHRVQNIRKEKPDCRSDLIEVQPGATVDVEVRLDAR